MAQKLSRSKKECIQDAIYNSNISYLEQAYGRPSDAKRNAWTYCEYLCTKYDGFRLRIISYNTFIFTAGFFFTDKETGVLKCMYITPTYHTEFECV